MIGPIRWVLALPLLALQFVVNVVVMHLVCFKFAHLLHRIGQGCGRHVYYPITKARRFVVGEPTWKPIDMQIGSMPRTQAQRELAHAEGFTSTPCHCGEPDCSGEIWMPPGSQLLSPGTGPGADRRDE